MKKVLVPIDFSPQTQHLLSYAIEIAVKMRAKLILAHVFWKTVYSFESPAEIRSKEAGIRQESLKKMEELENSFAFSGRNLRTECIVRNGYVAKEIVSLVNEMQIDLVVMGTKSVAPSDEAFIKTITTEVIENTSCPVLVVPKGSSYRGLHKMASAIDYHDSDLLHAIELTQMAQLFGAEVTLLNVSPDAYEPEDNNRLCQLQSKVQHHTFYEKTYTEQLKGADYIRTINEYLGRTGADLLAMALPKRNFLGQISRQNYAKRMTCLTGVPLLIFRAFNVLNTLTSSAV
jgi:nucleotide-binding universal stress UspA family protein